MKTDQQTTKGQGKPELPKYPETLEQVNEWIDAASASQNRVTRSEARNAIMLQLRKWREDGHDQIYFGALNIAPDLDEDLTFGHLIDIAFDNFFPNEG